MEDFIKNLESSLQRGFIDQTHPNNGDHQPQLLINSKKTRQDVLTTLTEELDQCRSFLFSVAFITESGLATLKSHLLDLKHKGVSGRILTSTYLSFNQPLVFQELLKIENVDVRLTDVQGFHAKGYIFEQDTHYTLIVGSSNLTAAALKVNHEWNIKLTSLENGEIIRHFQQQFEEMWQEAKVLTASWISYYKEKYKRSKQQSTSYVAELPNAYEMNPWEEALRVEPNAMQEAALKQVEAVRKGGKQKALIISATGTGKTYLAAFDVRRYASKRMLFISHREQILKKAKHDFQRVLGGPDRDYGLLSGTDKNTDTRYLFATVQTLSQDLTLQQFSANTFDYILIDEVHKAGAPSYQKVMDYFSPNFFMGMTATPERADDINIYPLFDHTIAYEIRLQEALNEDMVCPFHYFGVSDVEKNGKLVNDTTLLSNLVSGERVHHIIDKMYYYGWSGDKVRGLIFCSRKEEAHYLSEALNRNGFRTAALTGEDSQDTRLQRIDELENGSLDYIITVDIFNEGVDIPTLNQIVMLRQTASSIVFVQQLGRGLRKHDSKEFVTVIDFIGKYNNNYLIPIALSGDKSQNKDNIRRRMKDTSYIKGLSSIHFEEVAKKQIYQSITNTNLTKMTMLKEAYYKLKNRLGRIPYLADFEENNSIDPNVIVLKTSNYYRFLQKMGDIGEAVSAEEEQFLTMLSHEILPGKRAHESILLEALTTQDTITVEAYLEKLTNGGCRTDQATLTSMERILNLAFFTQNSKKKYGEKPVIVRKGDKYMWHADMKNSIEQNALFATLVRDIVTVALKKASQYPGDTPFQRYKKYTRQDAVKLLNWNKDESATVFGYKPKHQTCPIFITYHKDKVIDASVDYNDEFLSKDVIRWYTRSNRTQQSVEVQKILHAAEQGTDIHIFVKKNDDEGTAFYYLGQALPEPDTVEETTMKGKNEENLPVVRMNLQLDKKVEERLYHYLKEQ